jgi:hypothetical protein
MRATADAVRHVCDVAEAAAAAVGSPYAMAARELRARLDGPLRLAIAGRVKAGKSTLLNALVGARVAPTDAGECTRVVTWYQHGLGYDVVAQLNNGTSADLQFHRVDGALSVDLDGYQPSDITRIDVRWPSAALREVTLIDTPGLGSLDDASSLRTREFLAFGDTRASDADAVLYLMPHLHRRDSEFLGAFMDHSVSAASPVNAVVVLSRADEIGAGRLDAMESSARIADRYQRDELRTLCSAVIPVVGLLAETGQTLREDEASALRALAASDGAELDRMLLAVDTFLEPGASSLTVEMRLQLLERLGMFGMRLAMARLRVGPPHTASDLARSLVEASGIDRLRALLSQQFLPRSQVLKARSALVSLRAIANQLGPAGATVAVEIERCEATSLDFGLLRAAHLVRTGEAKLTDEESVSLERLAGTTTSVASRLGLEETTPADELRACAIGRIEHWRTRAAAPLAGSALAEVCETLARAYESLHHEVTGTAP